MKKIRALWRLLYFAIYTSLRIGQIILNSLIWGKDVRRSMRIRRSWARHLLPAIGIRLFTEGTPPDFPCILMCNHRSYLDPALLVYDVLAYPVSKAEVARWPIVGYGASVSGVLFLKRESATSRKITLDGIAERLHAGFPVILFPEGTTQSQPSTTTFRLGGFKLAVTEGFPIVPVAIDYADPADYWIGSDTFLPHFMRRFAEREMRVRVCYGEAIWGDEAQTMLEEAQTWIDSQLDEIRLKW